MKQYKKPMLTVTIFDAPDNLISCSGGDEEEYGELWIDIPEDEM